MIFCHDELKYATQAQHHVEGVQYKSDETQCCTATKHNDAYITGDDY